jgi:hypothetical protein
MTKTIDEANKALVLEAFDTLFNKRDYKAAERFWSRRRAPWYSTSVASSRSLKPKAGPAPAGRRGKPTAMNTRTSKENAPRPDGITRQPVAQKMSTYGRSLAMGLRAGSQVTSTCSGPRKDALGENSHFWPAASRICGNLRLSSSSATRISIRARPSPMQ